jgi:hypothetical protein
MAATIPQRINGKWGKISKKKGQTAADRSLLRVFFSHLPACVASVAGEQFLIPQKKHIYSEMSSARLCFLQKKSRKCTQGTQIAWFQDGSSAYHDVAC